MTQRRTSQHTIHFAKELRRAMTPAEARLWSRLRAHRLEGVKFRRQHPIGPYIADFAAPSRHLVIELDGSQHLDRQDDDARRTAYLAKHGYTVLRFFNEQVLNDMDGVLAVLLDWLQTGAGDRRG